MVSDKGIVRGTGLVDILDDGDAVMADKGLIIHNLLTLNKVHLISPASCGPQLTARGTTYSRRVASLRSHVERYILKRKQFQIPSVTIPLSLKPMLDRIFFLAAALCKMNTKPIRPKVNGQLYLKHDEIHLENFIISCPIVMLAVGRLTLKIFTSTQ